ncbi:50S ribosomal protein L5 [Candidatus Berkelbacteria bacterium CG_4_9_14_3_um_filter_39_23]|uniref:Large ribosomal subunit protein uL5 n=2 Tax=Candidatus Berkelbacteria TaxID=1618330 RepID=A0A2M7CJ40_9BACT|nr:MAG: 50S ribosomal protein L5 [Candidatus Berkelbacteria bacterium CG2_30_39_44]PIR28097.1 MAG: 50S ribosomal protein L5 [Candidatus Berkelbacteria bacterium CG11_big_fil_rev_8_21_14_0_20_40_23]PIV25673.1 MAG: 50S ribosomal protein L5 [Candidatus Berkelbacteria bacterium CG03_land_8_20_14_0_80_40_36]PIX30721.1 MAG: 50S ribosomal protein L5 [Candidatus Berkelbacteria bacterium CG_4_8_14_3_um_filter_39_27]PIZ28893.1 MAG: 50S ribosomal protein L5 [Candidatus Berkelbacteria bacterium CG_4_10_14_
MISNFKKFIIEKINPLVKVEFNISNNFELPKIEKITINSGYGKFRQEKEMVRKLGQELATLTGQKPVQVKAKKSIAGFKLRQGEKVAYLVTLRGVKMYDFLSRLINVALPSIRDFRGLNSRFDRQGNFSLGIKDHAVFPEITFEDLSQSFNLGININIMAKNSNQAKFFLQKIGMPFQKNTTTKKQGTNII